MSRHEEVIRWLARVAMFGDCAALGVVSVFVTTRLVATYVADSSALKRIERAPEVRVSDMKTIISLEGEGERDMLVVVKGTVEARSNLDAGMKFSTPDVLVSQMTVDVGVVLERTQMCKYNQRNGVSGWLWGLRIFMAKPLSEQKISSQRKVPFALVNTDLWPESKSAYILVNLDGSRQQLPLDTIYHQIHAIRATPYAFIQALLGHEYPVAVIEEEKMLLIGKEVYAVGSCCSKDGVLEIQSSEDLPYYLSNMNKGQMILDLTCKNRKLFWGAILLGSISVGILGYSVYRNWIRWKRWRLLRAPPINNATDDAYGGTREEWRTQITPSVSDPTDDAYSETSEEWTPRINNRTAAAFAEAGVDDEEDDNHDIPDGLSCVVCLVRNRRYAFVPCGHQVCCHRCANNVQNEISSQCPVCRQRTNGILRIYRS